LRFGGVLALLLDLLAARGAFFTIAIALGILGGNRHRAGSQQRGQGQAKHGVDAEDHVRVPTAI
jgi:hypothetical protein